MKSSAATQFFLRPLSSAPAAAPPPVERSPALTLYGPDDRPLGLALRRSMVMPSQALSVVVGARAVELLSSFARPAGAAVLIGAGLSPVAIAAADTLAVPSSVATEADRALASSVLFGLVGPATFDPAHQPTVRRGAVSAAVTILQNRLNALGYDVGEPDGNFGRQTRTGVLEYQVDHGLPGTGRVDQATWHALSLAQPTRPIAPAVTPGGVPILARYPPGAYVTERLFTEAAAIAHVPSSWAKSTALTALLNAESDGITGRPNYTYGNRSPREVRAELRAGIISATSSASGLGQLLLSNVETYYPSGRAGVGNPLEEAVGMLRYIQARYGSPEQAWAQYNTHHEGY